MQFDWVPVDGKNVISICNNVFEKLNEIIETQTTSINLQALQPKDKNKTKTPKQGVYPLSGFDICLIYKKIHINNQI
jgi:ATP-dependent protease Clp ATPase subunit